MNQAIFSNARPLKLLMIGIALVVSLSTDFLISNSSSVLLLPIESQTTGKLNEAKVFFDRALSKNVDNYGAIADFTEAIRLNPKYSEAYLMRGMRKAVLKDNYGAISDYTEAIRVKPNHLFIVSSYFDRGNAKSELGDYYGAITDLDEAIRLDPKLFRAYLNRGNTKAKMGDAYGSISDYTEAIRVYPEYADAYFYRGSMKFSLSDKEGAINDYTKAAELYDQQGETKKLQILLQKLRKSKW